MNAKTEALLERIDKQMDLVQDVYQELFQIKEMVLTLDYNEVDFVDLGFTFDIRNQEYRRQVPGYCGFLLFTDGIPTSEGEYAIEVHSPCGDYIDTYYFKSELDMIDEAILLIEDYLKEVA